MNWDNLDWDNFSCVDMTRRIKDEIDKEIANMTPDEVCEYLNKASVKFKASSSYELG
jgi:predicted transcriptional regulator